MLPGRALLHPVGSPAVFWLRGPGGKKKQEGTEEANEEKKPLGAHLNAALLVRSPASCQRIFRIQVTEKEKQRLRLERFLPEPFQGADQIYEERTRNGSP